MAVFIEKGESAKTADRTEFLRAIEYCRRYQKELKYFIVYKVDRFARKTEDHFKIRSQLASFGMSLVSATEPIGENPSERFVEAVLAASAEFDKRRAQDPLHGRHASTHHGRHLAVPAADRYHLDRCHLSLSKDARERNPCGSTEAVPGRDGDFAGASTAFITGTLRRFLFSLVREHPCSTELF